MISLTEFSSMLLVFVAFQISAIQNHVTNRDVTVLLVFLLQALSRVCEDNMLDYNPTTLYRSKSADALTLRRRSMAILS